LELGSFSIFNDTGVKVAEEASSTIDLDGIVACSRYIIITRTFIDINLYYIRSLYSFRLFSFGETRVFTKRNLVYTHIYTAKGGLPDFSEYPTNLRSYNRYRPGIILVETNGGTLYARLTVSATANSADIEIAKAAPTQIVTHFFFQFNLALRSLASTSRSRKYNLCNAIQVSQKLPSYFRLYGEDIENLSGYLSNQIGPFNIDYLYVKLGQQLRQNSEGIFPGIDTLFRGTYEAQLHTLASLQNDHSLFWNLSLVGLLSILHLELR